jgi:hypothetical protein
MTENPPSVMRLVGLAPIAAMLVSVGMLKTVDLVGAALQVPLTRWRDVALAGLIAVAAVSSINFYFLDYSERRTEGYGGPNTEVATEMALYLKRIGVDHHVFFFGPPRMYMGFPTIPFIARGVQGTDVLKPLESASQIESLATRNVFVFLPERRGELDVVRQRLPSGETTEVRSKEKGQLLFVAYRVDAPVPR